MSLSPLLCNLGSPYLVYPLRWRVHVYIYAYVATGFRFIQDFGLYRISVYSGFSLYRISVYSGFGLDRFHCIFYWNTQIMQIKPQVWSIGFVKFTSFYCDYVSFSTAMQLGFTIFGLHVVSTNIYASHAPCKSFVWFSFQKINQIKWHWNWN
jgi:hypothetical protein